MGDSYADALGKGLSRMNPEFVNLADNRLSGAGTRALLSKLKESVQFLNVSENHIDAEGALALGQFLKSKATKYP